MVTEIQAPGELRPGARAVRTVATLAVAVLLTAGTVWGNDDEFPFGPFRMFSTSTPASSVVSLVRLEALTADGEWRPAALSRRNIGLTRAEVEGQIPRFERDPELLGRIAGAHVRLRPRDEPWIGLRLLRVRHLLQDRRPTGEVEETLIAEWSLEEA